MQNVVPQPVSGLTDAVKISLGGRFGCALRATGDVVCWGYINDIGAATLPPYTTPVTVAGVTDAVDIAAHTSGHACARRRTGEVLCWGDGAIQGGRVPGPVVDPTIVVVGDNTGAGGRGANGGGVGGGTAGATGAGGSGITFGLGGASGTPDGGAPDGGAPDAGPSNPLVLITGDPSEPAVGATSDFVDTMTILDPRTVSQDANGSFVLRTQLVMAIQPTATVAEINRAITGVLGTIAAMTEARSIIVVTIPDPGNLTTLEIVRAQLAASAGVKYARFSRLAVPSILPPNPAYADPTQIAPIVHQLAVRASATWNLRGLLATARLADRLPATVMIDYFGAGQPDPVSFAFDFTAPDDFSSSLVPIADGHGYRVAGVAGAAFDNIGSNPADSVVGLFAQHAPFRGVDLEAFSYDVGIQMTVQAAKALREQGRNVIVNHSLGVDCINDLHAACSADDTLEAHLDGQELIQLVTGDPTNASASLQNAFLMFSSAGNNPNELAYHVSGPGAAAAGLEVPVTATANADTLAELDDQGRVVSATPLAKLGNIVSVEARDAFAGGPGDDPPRSVYPPAPLCLSSYATPGGSVSAIGTHVHTLDGGLPAAVDDVNGSSFASPQAAAAAAWIWALAPDLSADRVKQILLHSATPDSADPVSCPQAPETHGHLVIDAYNAALATDNPDFDDPAKSKNLGQADTAPVRLWLLDVASTDSAGNLLEDVPDGKFTQADIAKFLKEFRERAGQTDYSRYDLNGNSSTGEPYARTDIGNISRFDLDGDLVWTTAQQTVEGQVVAFDEEMPTDLGILIYYAYSPLYTGNEYERTMLLLPYLEDFNQNDLHLASMNVVAGPNQQTVAFDLTQSLPESTFISNCGLERGTPLFSEEVMRVARNLGIDPVFKRPLMANRISDETPNAASCSSFVATLPSTGRWWINAAARTQNTSNTSPKDSDDEYQMRVYLGEPDLAAEAAGSFTPPPNRVATQTIQFGNVLSDELNPMTSIPIDLDASFPHDFHLADVGLFPAKP